MTVALACALPARLSAQADEDELPSVFEIYGRVNITLERIGVDGRPSDYEVVDNTSRLGVRGGKDLGRGLRALFQIESRIRLDTGGAVFGEPPKLCRPARRIRYCAVGTLGLARCTATCTSTSAFTTTTAVTLRMPSWLALSAAIRSQSWTTCCGTQARKLRPGHRARRVFIASRSAASRDVTASECRAGGRLLTRGQCTLPRRTPIRGTRATWGV